MVRCPATTRPDLVDLTEELPAKAAAKVAERVLPRAPQQTVSQFGAAVRRAVLAVDGRSAEEKHTRARGDRRVYFGPPSAEGMCELWALLPADQAAELRAKVYALADTWKGEDDRTLDQRRADALCALGSGAGTVPKAVNVTVALSTLLGVDEHPADLDGEPVAAGIARALAFDPGARWRRLLTDDGGRLIDVVQPHLPTPGPAATLRRTPRRHLPVPGLPTQGRLLRAGPRHPMVRRWTDQRRQPALPVQTPPPFEAPNPVAATTTSRRLERVDRPHRPRLRTTTTRTATAPLIRSAGQASCSCSSPAHSVWNAPSLSTRR